MILRSTRVITALLLLFSSAIAQDDVSYKKPPQAILDLVMAKTTPLVSIDGKANWMILMQRSEYPGIDELARPEYRIAGLRIDPENFSQSRGTYYNNLQLKNVKSKETLEISGLPADLKAANIRWSPDESQFAFTNTTPKAVDLYLVSLADRKARKINKTALNIVLGDAFDWIGNTTLMYKTVVADASKFPGKPAAPSGPVVQESSGKAGASRTYQDLIKNQYDEALFEFYGTSQIVSNDLSAETKVGKPAIYYATTASPDNKYLMVSHVKKPFSYLVTYRGFPTTIEILNITGEPVKTLANNPSSEGAPIGFDDVVSYPRGFRWREDQPATIMYVKALDKGLGRSKAEYRDAIMLTSPAEAGEGKLLCKTRMRFGSIQWGNEHLALVYEDMNATRKQRVSILDPATGNLDSLFERSSNDLYSDIGSPVTAKNQYGRNVIWVAKDNKRILLSAQGESPEGSMPFVQSYDLKAKKGTVLWRCVAPYYERVVDVIDPSVPVLLTSRESQTEVANYYIRDLRKKSLVGTPITDFKNPYAQLEGIKKEKISYKRGDGINLTADLYLPKNYDAKKDGPLPVLIWAYPREYKNASDAAQVRGSKYTFTRMNYGSPIFWVTQGYAILDNAEMPIVGEGDKEPNDNFIPQLYLNAHAAIQAVASRGVGDSNRVAVGGHSYGAFMTANLLAHTKLFKGGIARSGAYNRTLTPFGFQAEERTYWQAPDVYNKMSPFNYADSIKTPLLLIHGEADNNPGTFPIQSERLYNAIKGHGGTVKLVFLPYESHGYAARENILHMLWEQNNWLEKYVKSSTANPGGRGSEQKKPF